MPHAEAHARPSRAITRLRTLMPALMSALALLLGAAGPASAAEIRIGGSGAALGTMQRLAEAYTHLQPDVKITVMQTIPGEQAIASALAGTIQIGVSVRPPNEAERQAGAAALEYGRTPLVLATSVRSGVTGLRTQDLVDAYAGRTAHWPDGSPMNLILRPPGDADAATIRSWSPAVGEALSTAEHRPGLLVIEDEREAARLLEKVPGAIGSTSLSLLRSEQRALRPLAIDGVRPTPEAIRDGRYPLVRSLFLVTPPRAEPAVQGFVAFVRSPQARRILQDTGHWVP